MPPAVRHRYAADEPAALTRAAMLRDQNANSGCIPMIGGGMPSMKLPGEGLAMSMKAVDRVMLSLVALLMCGCSGGSGGSGTGGGGGGGGTASTYTVGGSVSGLGASSVVLQNNGGNDLTVTANGTFTFSTALNGGAAYAVTVLTQPAGQNCSVTNGSGTVAQSNVTDVFVACADRAFTPVTATMLSTRALHTATLLPDGRILITGGIVDGTMTALDTAELYDPATNVFTAIGARMTAVRNQHAATLLANGQVLITGGSPQGDGDGMNSAELYDPATQTFTALTATMTTPRGGHAAALLPNGKVFISGGFFDGPLVYSAELYDPVANTFTAVGATMTTSRELHTATLAPNGKVLLIGGSENAPLDNAESYDPTAGTFTPVTATMTSARASHTATLLADGRILVAGGTAMPFSGTGFTALDTTEFYDASADSFTALSATLTTPRGGHTATLMPDGRVLVIGGVTTATPITVLNTVEAYGN